MYLIPFTIKKHVYIVSFLGGLGNKKMYFTLFLKNYPLGPFSPLIECSP